MCSWKYDAASLPAFLSACAEMSIPRNHQRLSFSGRMVLSISSSGLSQIMLRLAESGVVFR